MHTLHTFLEQPKPASPRNVANLSQELFAGVAYENEKLSNDSLAETIEDWVLLNDVENDTCGEDPQGCLSPFHTKNQSHSDEYENTGYEHFVSQLAQKQVSTANKSKQYVC